MPWESQRCNSCKYFVASVCAAGACDLCCRSLHPEHQIGGRVIPNYRVPWTCPPPAILAPSISVAPVPMRPPEPQAIERVMPCACPQGRPRFLTTTVNTTTNQWSNDSDLGGWD